MKIEQRHWTHEQQWQGNGNGHGPGQAADLVLAFGGRECLSNRDRFDELRAMYPQAQILAASTAGEIIGTAVCDDTISVTAIQLERGRVASTSMRVDDPEQSYEVGRRLVRALDPDRLRHVLVVSDGLRINGSDLARGLREGAPAGVAVTGGLAGDGATMARTLVGLDAAPVEHNVVVVGLYGDDLRIGFGSLGGWDAFGPERRITRSKGNVLFELDGQSALRLYKDYLGELARELPSSALLFPLSLRIAGEKTTLVRTILGVDEAQQSLTFAGDMPVGGYATLMKANFDRLIDGAASAATGSLERLRGSRPELALLISCVGRKLILRQRVEEEVEAVRDVLGGSAVMTGFYSYGEVCPHPSEMTCELHNQTMTITTLSEA